MEFVEHIGAQNVLVATKLDKLAANKRKPALHKIRKEFGSKVLGYSAETSEGRDVLWRHLLGLTGLLLEPPKPRKEGEPARSEG